MGIPLAETRTKKIKRIHRQLVMKILRLLAQVENLIPDTCQREIGKSAKRIKRVPVNWCLSTKSDVEEKGDQRAATQNDS